MAGLRPGWLFGAMPFLGAEISKLRIELLEAGAGCRNPARLEDRMTIAGAAMAHLAEYREDVLFEQSPAEARQVRVLGGRLRGALAVAGISRRQFAERTGLPVELIVAIENGFGRPETAQRVLEQARAGLGHP